jgi:hypothetical protein
MKALIQKYLITIIVVIGLVAGAALLFHYWNPLKGLIGGEQKTVLYDPGKDPKIREMFVIDSVKDIMNHKLDSISNATIKNLRIQIAAYEQDDLNSQVQVTQLGKKKTAQDQYINQLKPGTEKENAINAEWNKRHPKK